MKNILPTPKCKNLYRSRFLSVLALLITLNLLLTSCVQEPESPPIELTESDQVSQVRAWFEENKSKLRLPEKGSNFRSESQELILPFFEKEPDWDKFHHYFFPDGREVFEISLENATKYFPRSMLDSFPDRNPAEVVIQNIMFIKHPTQERFDPVIARYYPDNAGSKKHFEELHYQSIAYDWSGTIEMFTYDERHFVGFEIKEGEVVSNYTLKSHEGEKRKSTANMDVRCHTTFHPVGYQVCVGGTCYTTIERYIAQTSCSGSSGTDSMDYFSIPRKEDDSKTPATDGTGGNCSSCEDPTTVPKPEKQNKDEKRKAQLNYLRSHGGEDFVKIIEELLNTPGLTMGDVEEVNNLVNNFYLRQKGLFMLNIFSPDNISALLTLGLANPNMTALARNKTFQLISRYASQNENTIFKSFTSSNFRANLTLKTGINPTNAQAHHVFPQNSEFANFFTSKGINVHNPTFGAWWPTASHQQNWYAYNQAWKDWIALNQTASPVQVIEFAKKLMGQYGIAVLF